MKNIETFYMCLPIMSKLIGLNFNLYLLLRDNHVLNYRTPNRIKLYDI